MMTAARIDELLDGPAYGLSLAERSPLLLELLRDQVRAAAARSPAYANVVRHWPVAPDEAGTIAELPFLPVTVFKRNPPLALVPEADVMRVLHSSSTTGRAPSRIAVDRATALRMTRGAVQILRDFVGPERRPYLVVDVPAANAATTDVGARGAAIRALLPFASSVTYALRAGPDGEPAPDVDALRAFVDAHGAGPCLVYGFTSVLWTALVRPLAESGLDLGLADIHLLHSGGWKKLAAEAVSKADFTAAAASVFGCAPERVIDYYGMVENLGIVYPDCRCGNKHAPVTGEAIVRDPLTLAPVGEGETGLLQVCSVLPESFPGHLLLTEDLATVVLEDGCPCGRPGLAFRFAGRAPRTETRGCGNVDACRPQPQEVTS